MVEDALPDVLLIWVECTKDDGTIHIHERTQLCAVFTCECIVKSILVNEIKCRI